MKEVLNCPKCGRIFVKAFRSICPFCQKEQDHHFNTVSTYMKRWKNRMATTAELHEETKVPLQLIYQFVREGRLPVSQFPNLGYPCESCGDLIREGRLCTSCKVGIDGGLKKLEREKEFEQRKEATIIRERRKNDRNGRF